LAASWISLVAGAGGVGLATGRRRSRPEDSLAAAVADSGRDALAAGHGPLDRPRGREDAVGDAAAVALAVPLGRGRGRPAHPLTLADLLRLRALLRRQSSRSQRSATPRRAAREPTTRTNPNRLRRSRSLGLLPVAGPVAAPAARCEAGPRADPLLIERARALLLP
jgi:hypothetical protein